MIEATKILQTDLLDLLFDGRNKQYGAYELRRKYNKRMIIAVIIMIASCILFFMLYAFAKSNITSRGLLPLEDITLVTVEPETKKPEVIPPPPKAIAPPIETRQFTTPKITNEDVKPDERPPEMDELEDTKIGKVNIDGDKDLGIVAPPISDGRGVIEVPKQKEEEDWEKTFLIVQIESEYPGGLESWKRYLNKNIRYPEEAVENEIEGTVLIQFIVDKEGNVSDVSAISGPNELRGEAERVIRKSGKWTPASQNGRKVKSYKKQPITFVLQRD